MNLVSELVAELRSAQSEALPGQYRTVLKRSLNGVLVAIGGGGTLHILLPMRADAAVVEDRKSTGVQLRRHELEDEQRERKVYADLVCLRADLEITFLRLADEVVSEMASSKLRADAVARAALDRWRELLDAGVQSVLSDNEIAGLFGELLTLKEVLTRGADLESWTGNEPSRHDFRFGDDAVEVKTSRTTQRDVVHINGSQQLDPPAHGNLYLRRVRVDMAPSGVSVPDLVASLVDAGVSRSELFKRLLRRGYVAADESFYADKKFEVREDDLWVVADGFPRLRPECFVQGAPPPGVHISSYEIDLAYASSLKLNKAERERIQKEWI